MHGGTMANSTWTSPAAPAAWLPVCHLGKVKKAEGTAVGICGFVHMGTLPAADRQWPVAGVCNEPISAQIWG